MVFGVAGFAFGEWIAVLAILSAAVVAGTWIGSRLLDYVNEVWFIRLYKTVLTVIALRLALFFFFSGLNNALGRATGARSRS